ncbi:ribonuclease HII [Terasakiispira papahanaumokuakeensis]|uniref:Ribonuclease HII n=1 Tax=Terasakiispira papahanaumokuakeensis TaxID=197479 RepID=A0A1E2VB74_9GAMM|nr:ribonuclease HII [Terasakiispira papahanaumokuakeensis]ODC04247.1 ribonuclease HII [Terasakiispira papahanaumokuakeensis]
MPTEAWPEIEIPYTGLYLAGMDEVGRGPLIGNVVTAAVILDPQQPIEGLTDSKKLSEKRREQFFDQIMAKALCVGVGECTPQEIDTHNILQATFIAMGRALDQLAPAPEYVLVDGNKMPPKLRCPGQAVVKGDLRHPAISAASIIAKVIRDRQMHALHDQHPVYGFDRHKGYPTAQHLKALETYGPLPEHRRSFGPVQRQLNLF